MCTQRKLKLNTHQKGVMYRFVAAARNGASYGGESSLRIAFLPPSKP